MESRLFELVDPGLDEMEALINLRLEMAEARFERPKASLYAFEAGINAFEASVDACEAHLFPKGGGLPDRGPGRLAE